MKIPQGLYKRTSAQISLNIFQIHQIREKSVLLKKKKNRKSEIILLLKNKSDSLDAWWETFSFAWQYRFLPFTYL